MSKNSESEDPIFHNGPIVSLELGGKEDHANINSCFVSEDLTVDFEDFLNNNEFNFDDILSF